jgi:hypothetical protein
MPKLRVHNFSLSIDGYAAGPEGGPVGYECVELVASPSVVHARFVRSAT